MKDRNKILQAEKDIDLAFGNNKLKEIGYTQSIWTLLSVAELRFLQYLYTIDNPLDNDKLSAIVDTILNTLTHPLRVCFNEANKNESKLKKILIDEQYKLAEQWLDDADNYDNFCTIFPLWYKGKIEIKVSKNQLIPTDWTKLELEYEAYNRLYRDFDNVKRNSKNYNDLSDEIIRYTSFSNNEFKVNFNPRLVKKLVDNFSKTLISSYYLPENWKFTHFSIGEFKLLFITIQSLLYAWFLAKKKFIQQKNDFGYVSSVWVVPKDEFFNRIIRYTKLNKNTVKVILDYLEFGGAGIREPDIALQPLVDLKNGSYALSPFIWLNLNPERNLCALLNQIPIEKKIYSKLVIEKEVVLRNEIEKKINDMNLDVKNGKVRGTDIDCAIIDRNEKSCLILELKWFIEPAEIREVIDRSEELFKGIKQAKKIIELFKSNDTQLMRNVLEIDKSYSFFVVVATHNWIGEFDVQDSKIPIIKIWPLIKKIKKHKSLIKIFSWLENREYLPKRNEDFYVIPINISVGNWKSKWYALKPA